MRRPAIKVSAPSNSIFYPACGVDLIPIKLLSSISERFMYCDWGKDALRNLENTLNQQDEISIKNHRIGSFRNDAVDYPLGFVLLENERERRQQRLPRILADCMHIQYAEYTLEYDNRTIYLTHINAEALTIYSYLFQSGHIAPEILINVNSGAGLGGGFVKFEDPDGITKRFLSCCEAKPLIWIRGGMRGNKNVIKKPVNGFYDYEIKSIDDWGESYLVSAFAMRADANKASKVFML